jgi:hypothetical protein
MTGEITRNSILTPSYIPSVSTLRLEKSLNDQTYSKLCVYCDGRLGSPKKSTLVCNVEDDLVIRVKRLLVLDGERKGEIRGGSSVEYDVAL